MVALHKWHHLKHVKDMIDERHSTGRSVYTDDDKTRLKDIYELDLIKDTSKKRYDE